MKSRVPHDSRRFAGVFDALYATQVESLAAAADTQLAAQAAGAALLDRIGPAILLTHSQAGPLGWLIADIRPALVKGIVALEPSGAALWQFDDDAEAEPGLGPHRHLDHLPSGSCFAR